MLTKNWYRAMGCFMCQDGTIGTSGKRMNDGGDYPIAYATGQSMVAIMKYAKTFVTGYKGSSIKEGVVFGNGNTAPTVEDYTMAGDHFTAYTGSAGLSLVETENAAELKMIYTLTNTGVADFTINEVGMVASYCLVDRTVLDSPVTIPAGGIGQVTYSVKLNYPTA